MCWRVIINTILLSFSISLYAQDLEQTYNLAEVSFKQGDYKGAKDFYNRVVFFDTSDSYVNSYYNLGEIAFLNKEYKKARKYYVLHSNWTNSDSVRIANTFKAVLCSFMLDEYKQALVDLLLIKSKITDSELKKRWTLHLAVCYFQDHQYEKSKELFHELIPLESKDELNKIFKKNNRLEKKFNKVKVQLMSIFLPGMGQFYTGNVGPGINSFVLVGSFLYLFTRAVKILSVPDAILAVYPWLSRYYLGGVKKSAKFAEEKVKIKRSSYYQKILKLVQNQG